MRLIDHKISTTNHGCDKQIPAEKLRRGLWSCGREIDEIEALYQK